MKPKPFQLTEAQGRALLNLARAALSEKFNPEQAAAGQDKFADVSSDPAFHACCGVFVTLKMDGCLRGCIGTLDGREPLIRSVCTYALHSAFNDPRFESLTERELDRVALEVSVLTDPRPLTYQDAEDLLGKLQPHIDGVTLRKGYCSATFLPQVWEQLPNPESFLSNLCLKAGLPATSWQTGEIEVETYQVQCFSE